jgi:hypothetical protein
MILLFGVLALLGAALILPGWLLAGKQDGNNHWLLLLPAAGIVCWICLAALGIGAQSLANLIETPGVVTLSVLAAYGKFLVLDRKLENNRQGMILVFVLVLAATVALRLFMPALPE